MVDLNALNPQQRLAVETIRGPVLILAGAGTGKTRVITFRIAHLIGQGVAPGNILGVTFTNKAAREMQERVAKLVPRTARSKAESLAAESASRFTLHASRFTHSASSPDRPTICTFHSFCVRVLRQHIDRLGYKRNFVIYDEPEQLGAIKKVLSQISEKGEKVDPAAALSVLSRLRNGALDATLAADSEDADKARLIRARYESALRACNAVDFDDLILLTLRLFSEHAEVLAECRTRYRYVMVDEYQDTNAAQFKLVHALTQGHRNLCVVGDDDQSIYGWRGAEIGNLLDLEKYFPEVRVIKLEQNYRSTNVILNAANALIKHNVRRRSKQLWSVNGQGTKISLHTFQNDDEEARGVVEQIEYARRIRRIPWSSQAVLFRTNLQSRPLETALRQANVRYHLIGGQSYFDRREVKDFLAYLKLLLNPHDDISLLRVANVPPRGLSGATMEQLLAASQEHRTSVFGAMTNPALQTGLAPRTRENVAKFVEWIERTRSPLAAPTALSLEKWADRFLSDLGYFEELRRSEKDPEAGENRVRNLQDLLASLDGVAATNVAPMQRLGSFLEEITLDTEREEKEPEGEAVTMITMHSCKGLEFPHVYIVGLEDGLLPHTRSKTDGSLDEERRLFYVAITRAMLSLTITHCLGRRKYGEEVPCHPSPFLRELPEDLVERAEERGQQSVTVESGRERFANLRASLD
ncbi:MAG: exodeoxyribonuclease V subunit gamma [Verrucomicrobia bacterium]|nr:exodeoxyribonuclease V subunit gamma [Verrucomicrobiota bacterium]